MRKLAGAEIYLLKASSPEIKALWIKSIKECHDKKRPGLLKGLALFALLSNWIRKRSGSIYLSNFQICEKLNAVKNTPNINSRNAEKEISSGVTTLLKRFHYLNGNSVNFVPRTGRKSEKCIVELQTFGQRDLTWFPCDEARSSLKKLHELKATLFVAVTSEKRGWGTGCLWSLGLRLGQCCVEVHYGTAWCDKFGPSFLHNCIKGNERS